MSQRQWQPHSLGIYGSLNMNFHSFTGVVDSLAPVSGSRGTFGSGQTSLGATIGLTYQYRMDDNWAFGGRVGYTSLPLSLTGSGRTVDTLASFAFDASLGYLEIMPLAYYHNLFVDNLYGKAGFQIGIPISKTYSLSQTADTVGAVAQPLGTDVSIPEASTRFALALGAGYSIPLSKSVVLAPEVSLHIPLTKVSSNTNFNSWNVPQLRLGVALTFGFGGGEDGVAESGASSGLRIDGMEVRGYNGSAFVPTSRVRVEDQQYAESYPLIPYVFFRESRTGLAESNQVVARESATGSFSLEKAPQDAIEINNNTLSVIAERMKASPGGTITVTGYHDGKKENREISKARAEAVKQYLVGAGIAENRIKVEAKDLPPKPSSRTVAEGDAENRRVEITAQPSDLLDPVVVKRDIQRIADPSILEFAPSVSGTAPVQQWTLTVTQSGRTLREFNRDGVVVPVRWIIKPDELSAKEVPVEYEIVVVDSTGARVESSGSVPVEYISSSRKKVEQLPDKTIEKFSLVLFDFDKSDITPDNKRVLEKMVLPSVKFNSTVKVYGYTDAIGDAAYNKRLAKSRADAVRDLIKASVKDAKVESFGVGEDVLIFEQEAAVGRMLSRTVQVVVETPTK